MVFELFGIPGSGKSYCCNELESNGYVKDIMKFYKENFAGKILFHIFLSIFQINKKLKKIYKRIIKLLGDISLYTNIIDPNVSIELYIKYMIFVFFIENTYTKKDIIVDEGIIHYCIVLYAEFSVELNKINKIIDILKIENEKKIIGLRCKKEESIMRIKKRNRKRTPMDFLEYTELEEILDRYLEAEKYLANRFKHLELEDVKDEIIKQKEIRNGKI